MELGKVMPITRIALVAVQQPGNLLMHLCQRQHPEICTGSHTGRRHRQRRASACGGHAACAMDCATRTPYRSAGLLRNPPTALLSASAVDGARDAQAVLDSILVPDRHARAGDLVADGHPEVVQVVLAPKNLQVLACKKRHMSRCRCASMAWSSQRWCSKRVFTAGKDEDGAYTAE